MKKLLAIMVLCVCACLFYVQDAVAKDVVICGHVVDIKFEKNDDGFGAVFFKIKETEYSPENILKGKEVFYRVNVSAAKRIKDTMGKYSPEQTHASFWVLHIIADHFTDNSWKDMPYIIAIDPKKKEIKNIFYSD